jgi:cell fate regulator YaaT (PSP1 superfamily)
MELPVVEAVPTVPVVNVSFRRAGKVYWFAPGDLELKKNDFVIAETQRGLEMGQVLGRPKTVPEDQVVPPLRPILRLATLEDHARRDANTAREESALELCRRRVESRGLPMKLLASEYTFDGGQIVFYFTSEGRVDFRELVKDLAAGLRTRIQLHQVGARDAAKLLGGIGPCGRSLCCSTWLTEFAPISMKMAKEQSLFLNPTKFSGACGKLMCCLRYEYDFYRETKAQMPAVGVEVSTSRGKGKVVAHNIARESVTVELPDAGNAEFKLGEVVAPIRSGCSHTGGCGTCPIKQAMPKPAPRPDTQGGLSNADL